MIDSIKKEVLEYINYNDKFNKYLTTINNITKISKGNIIFVILHESSNINKDDEEKLHKNLDRIYKFANNLGYIFNIHLILSPFKKSFNKNLKLPLNKFNTNTGFTYLHYANSKNIYIFRKEEYIKVIYHEIIHHIPFIDGNFKPSNIDKLKSHFKILANNILPNEAIVELWATIIFLKQLSIETKKDFYELFKEELNYSLFKSYQINKLQQLNNGYWKDNKTQIYSYIIFKTILMYNIDKLCKIYTFPYNDDIITDFLITNSKLPLIDVHNNSKRKPMSLCYMVNSDL